MHIFRAVYESFRIDVLESAKFTIFRDIFCSRFNDRICICIVTIVHWCKRFHWFRLLFLAINMFDHDKGLLKIYIYKLDGIFFSIIAICYSSYWSMTFLYNVIVNIVIPLEKILRVLGNILSVFACNITEKTGERIFINFLGYDRYDTIKHMARLFRAWLDGSTAPILGVTSCLF